MPEQKATPIQATIHARTASAPATLQNIQLSLSFGERIHPELLRETWQMLVAAHGILRTSFRLTPGGELRSIENATAETPWQFLEWQNEAPGDVAARWNALQKEDEEQPIPLDSPSLARLNLIALPGGQGHLLASFSRLILDEESLFQILGEWLELYDRAALGDRPELVLDTQVPEDFWARRSGDAAQYWKNAVPRDTPATRLEFRPRPGAGTDKPTAQCRRILGREFADETRAFCQSAGIDVQTLLLGAWALVLGRLSGGDSALMMVAQNCRAMLPPDATPPAGSFVNLLPMHFSLRDNPALIDWIKSVGARNAQSARQSGIGVDRMLTLSGSVSKLDGFRCAFALRGEDLTARIRDAMPRWINVDARATVPSGFDAMLAVRVDRVIELDLEYSGFPETEAEDILRRVERVIAFATEFPESPLSTVPMLSPDEEALIGRRSIGRNTGAAQRPVHELFRAQARRTPDAVAVTDRENSLTYQELDAHSDRLAQHLMQQKVSDGWVVGVCLSPSCWVPVALLGAMKAGNAVVPVDPGQKPEWIERMLTGHDVELVLCDSNTTGRLINELRRRVVLDQQWDGLGTDGGRLPAVAVSSLAAMIIGGESDVNPPVKSLSHATLATACEEVSRHRSLESGSNVLAHSPGGQGSYFEDWIAPLLGGATTVVERKDFLDEGALTGITHLRLTEPQWSTWVRRLVNGQAALPETLAGISIELGSIQSRTYTEWQALTNGSIPLEAFFSPVGISGMGLRYVSQDRYGATLPLTLVPAGGATPAVEVFVWDKQRCSLPRGYAGDVFFLIPGIRGEDPMQPVSSGLSGWRDEKGWIHLFSASEGRKHRNVPGESEETAMRALTSTPSVAGAFVRRVEEASEAQLMAWVVTAGGAPAPEPAPPLKHVIAVPEFPVLPSGWIDVKALPQPSEPEEPKPKTVAKVRTPRGDASEAWLPIIRLQKEGRDSPLFLVHDASGALDCYRTLVGRLGKHRPIYGFHARGLHNPDACHGRIEDAAASYIEAMSHDFPVGPYYLAGCGFGGVVAMEMARQLLTAGRQVGELAIIGATPPARVPVADRFGSISKKVSGFFKGMLSKPREEKPLVQPAFPEVRTPVEAAHGNAFEKYQCTPLEVEALVVLPSDAPDDEATAWLECLPYAKIQKMNCVRDGMLKDPAAKRLSSILNEVALHPTGDTD